MLAKPKILTVVAGVLFIAIVAGLSVYFFKKNAQPPNNIPRGTALEFSLNDLQKHNTLESCWIAFNGQVYDITRHLITLDEQVRDSFVLICGNSIDSIPDTIKTTEKLSTYQIGILTP